MAVVNFVVNNRICISSSRKFFHTTKGDPSALDFSKLTTDESTRNHLKDVKEFVLRDAKANLSYRERLLHLAKEADELGALDWF